jgi:hypothetical protein
VNAIATPSDPAASQNELIHRIGGLLLGDPALATLDWEGHALVAAFEDGALRLSGFAYLPAGDYVAATPKDPQLPGAIRELRDAMKRSGTPEWGVCVIRIVRAMRKITVEFEYDDPARWAITPATLAQVAERGRPS